MPLSDISIRQAKPSEKAQKLFDGGGLYLMVMPTGGKLWRLRYTFDGKEKLISLGKYPVVPLAKARQRRDEARTLLDDGVDPSQARKAAKQVRRAQTENSFEVIARRWYENWKPARSPRHAAQVLRRMEADVFPEIGSKPIATVMASDLIAMALKIESRGALDLSKRAYQICSQVLRYAVAHGIIERNAAADVKPSDALAKRKKTNYARLDPSELPELLDKIDTYDGSVYTRLALRLMTLTFVRTSELIGARWDEFDLKKKQWRIPAERMKMDTPHIVPLAHQALHVLAELDKVRFGRALLFPGERNPEVPMSNNTILFALYRMGYRSRMTGHGFRGMASTILHELAYRHDVIELQLAHQERDDVSAAYNYATYMPERTAMMQAWADHLDILRTEQEAVTT